MKRMVGAAIAIAVLFLSACAAVEPSVTGSVAVAKADAGKPVDGGIVYLLRGGFNVFSTGMDELAVKLRARGFNARAEGHAVWPQLAAEARQRYARSKAPIVIIGHSWGALAAILMAFELEKSGTPVALMILYDTTESAKIPRNVRHVVNFSSPSEKTLGATVTGAFGFSGKIDTVDVSSFGHFSLDNAPPLHEASIAEVMKVIRPDSRAAGQ